MKRAGRIFFIALIAGALSMAPAYGGSPPADRALNAGLGPMQMFPAGQDTTAPQSLTRQLTAGEESIRQSALAAVGAPGEYLERGHVAYPRSIALVLAPLGTGNESDAMLTLQLDHHLLTAILVPQGDRWRRIATVLLPLGAANASLTPSTFAAVEPSLADPSHDRAVFHAWSFGPGGGMDETEAEVRILNDRAVVTASMIAESRECAAGTRGRGPARCSVVRRWLDALGPLTLVTGRGMLPGRDAENSLASSAVFEAAHLREFSCQRIAFSAATLHYVAAGATETCSKNHRR